MYADGALENRPSKHKSMKLAIFTTKIDARGQLREERFVQFPAGERPRQNFAVNAYRNRTKTLRLEVLN